MAEVSDRERDDLLDGVLFYDEARVATLAQGELYLHGSGESVGYIRKGFLYSLKGQRLAAVKELVDKGQVLSPGLREVLKL